MTIEILTESLFEFQAQIADSRIKGLQKRSVGRTAARVYRNGCLGIAGATGNAVHEVAKLVARAESALAREIPYRPSPTESLQKSVVLGSVLLSESEFANHCDALLSKVRDVFPEFVFSHKLKMVEKKKSLSNDVGLDLSFTDRFYEMILLFKKKGSLDILDGDVSLRTREPNFNGYFSFICECLNAFLTPVNLPQGNLIPVIWLESENPLINLFERELNGRKFATGNSLFSGKCQQQLFSERLTLIQDNTAQFHTGNSFFDHEGIVNPDFELPLIERGILLAPYTDKRTALEFGLQQTGSSGGDYDAVPSIQGFTPRLKQTHRNLNDLLQGQPAILVGMAGGGDFDSAGKFGSPVQSAFLYENGMIKGRLPEFHLSDDYQSIFGSQFRGVCHAPFVQGGMGGVFVVDMKIC